MPDTNTFKLAGTKLVPINRFNLEPAKPSTAFSAITAIEPVPFTVVEHPVLQSINIAPIVLTPLGPQVVFVPKEYFPLIENSSDITEDKTFTDFNDKNIQLVFPKIEIAPNNGTLFYYEELPDSNGNSNNSFIGKITLKYKIVEKQLSANQKSIPVNLKEAVLNLITKDLPVKINGIVDTDKKEILFNIKNEAVKIAFLNLITNIDELKCNLDLYFDFKGYTKYKKKILFAQNLRFNEKLLQQAGALQKKDFSLIQRPLIIKSNVKNNSLSRIKIEEIKKDNNIQSDTPTEYIKSAFLLKLNKTVNYPLSTDKATSLYKTVDGGVITNPFNLNEDFSQFQQVFVPGVNFEKLSIYKSTVAPNEFLLIPKKYHISRDSDTKKPCINSIFHLYEEGTGLTEDISKVEFEFAIGPNLSEFEITKLKIELLNNNFLDGGSTNFIDDIRFLYPSDIDASFEINGNHLLQNADVTVDGKHFLFSLSTEKLNEASLLINAINNSVSIYANINFRHKEIKDTSVIDINIEKTLGDFLNIQIDNAAKKIRVENTSISDCRINSAVTIDETTVPFFNSSAFSNQGLLLSNGIVEFPQVSLNPDLLNKNLKQVDFSFESIEKIDKEFKQIVLHFYKL
ncbi:MAG: hypothetical protein QM710_10505 [Flavobacterium sp.]